MTWTAGPTCRSGQIPEFLDRNPATGSTTALLHTEIMSGHPLVHNGRLTGLFDFEPATHGAMLTAYGYETIDEQVQRRLLAYFFLHRYGNLRLALNVAPTSATTLDELAEHWWHVS